MLLTIASTALAFVMHKARYLEYKLFRSEAQVRRIMRKLQRNGTKISVAQEGAKQQARVRHCEMRNQRSANYHNMRDASMNHQVKMQRMQDRNIRLKVRLRDVLDRTRPKHAIFEHVC